MSTHPQKLGKYRITAVLGQGAMGVVYKGFDPDIRRTVAIKTIRNLEGGAAEFGADAVDRFRNEAQAAGRLSHPGIVGVFEYGEDGGVAFIAMEFVEGHSLAEYQVAKVRFEDDDVVSAMAQLLDALDHAHEQRVWHRDIKPANLIMTRSGRIKVSDFGIARIESAGLTRTTALVGTPSYMAPEQFLGRAIDHRVDLYGAGVVLYQLLTGHTPFAGTTESVMYKVVHEAPVMPSQVEGAARSAVYDGVVARALAKSPDQRFANAAAFKSALLAATGRSSVGVVSDAVVSALPPPREPPSSGNAPTEVTPSRERGSSGGSRPGRYERTQPVPPYWDPAQLLKVETALARYIGPMAAVLVRRAARDCRDMASLRAKLADQVNHPTARAALLGQRPPPKPDKAEAAADAAASSFGHSRFGHSTFNPPTGGQGSGGSSGFGGSSGGHSLFGPGTGPGIGGNSSFGPGHGTGGSSGFNPSTGGHSGFGPATGGQGLSDTLLEGAYRLLAQRVGPIARVMVKKAVAKAPQRDAFFALLLEAVDSPMAKEKLLTELKQLK
jgi:serine/threonine-protein kinase